MKRFALITSTLVLVLAATAAFAAEALGPPPPPPGPPLAGQLVGRTLNAVTYSPAPAGSRNGELSRIMLQAYLGNNGRALIRMWDATRGGYTAPLERRWSVENSTLCLDLPTRQFCADVHIWGPRIAGVGRHPYAMLDGDLQPGNAIGGIR